MIAPYLHLERATLDWVTTQSRLWRLTRTYLDDHEIALPVIAVLAVGWRGLHPTQGIGQLPDFWTAMGILNPTEVAIAASKVNAGAHPDDRLAELLVLIRQIRRSWPVILWRGGAGLGEAAVVGGAIGYETGIGWNESCNLNQARAQHRREQDGHPAARPVYIDALGRSIPKRTLEALRDRRPIWTRLICLDPDCCEPGGATYLKDARAHAIVARASALADLDAIDGRRWKWHQLADRATAGLQLAERIERVRVSGVAIDRIDTKALQATAAVAASRRHRLDIRQTA